MLRSIQQYAQVALLVLGSAILLLSCDRDSTAEEPNDETLMTEYSEHLTMTSTENGHKSYIFTAPLVEGYSLAKEPYQEFRKGVDIVTYQKDSTGAVDATLTANYAIHYGNRKLWEAKGNVVVKKSNGQELYTQQLFWNEKTRRIWSNVDTKIVEEGGRGSYIVEGFESDDQLKDWTFRRIKGRMLVNIEPTREVDSTSVKPAPADTPPAKVELQEKAVEKPLRQEKPKTQLTPIKK